MEQYMYFDDRVKYRMIINILPHAIWIELLYVFMYGRGKVILNFKKKDLHHIVLDQKNNFSKGIFLYCELFLP
jgi:hypothetical protein